MKILLVEILAIILLLALFAEPVLTKSIESIHTITTAIQNLEQ